MHSEPLPDGWDGSAGWLVQAIDPAAGLARLVRMDEAAYRAASFLDDRLLADGREARLCALADVVALAQTIERDQAGWIFHIGHVGSTLVSRLLGDLPGVLALREPRSLRDLAGAAPAERPHLATALRKTLGGGLAATRTVVIKATSFVSDVAPLLVAPRAPALFLYASPRAYIEGILAGENSVIELRAMADERARRLQGRGIAVDGFDRDDAHRAAIAWLCEMTALEQAATTLETGTVLWADFDAMLADPGAAVAAAAAHFGAGASREQVDAVVAGPLMRTYSKAPQFDYSPALRARVLADAGHAHRAAIDAALAALAATAARHELAARALARGEGKA